VELQAGEPFFDMVELARNPFLFDPEKVERDGIRVSRNHYRPHQSLN
jgi:hypothetical protein